MVVCESELNEGRTKMNIVNMDENIAKSITSTLHKVGGNLNVSEELMKILVILSLIHI